MSRHTKLRHNVPVDVTVVGLGFVGAPIAEAASKNGFNVSGVDISAKKLREVGQFLWAKDIPLSTELSQFKDSDLYILALPTPLTADNHSDLSAILDVVNELSVFLTNSQTVIIESTYPPGSTRNLVLPVLGKNLAGEDINLAYSPERINPGDEVWSLENTPKLISYSNEKTKKLVSDFYKSFVKEIVYVDSFEIAETAKLLENIYRFVNISFINEFQQNCEALGIDASKVIAAASTKPFGFQKFTPSLGIGGHCIPIAPHHFAQSLKDQKVSNGFIEHGTRINQSHLLQVIEKIEREFAMLEGEAVLVVGVTYKPGVADTRESPAVTLITHLRERGVQVSWYDPLVSSLNGEESGALTGEADVALICVQQPEHVISEILDKVEMVLDISSGLDIRRLK